MIVLTGAEWFAHRMDLIFILTSTTLLEATKSWRVICQSDEEFWIKHLHLCSHLSWHWIKVHSHIAECLSTNFKLTTVVENYKYLIKVRCYLLGLPPSRVSAYYVRFLETWLMVAFDRVWILCRQGEKVQDMDTMLMIRNLFYWKAFKQPREWP